jgi:hypothetical protein
VARPFGTKGPFTGALFRCAGCLRHVKAVGWAADGEVMSKIEARAILARRLEELRGLPYAELRERLGGREAELEEAVGDSGRPYNVELEGAQDNPGPGDLRVTVSVDDGGLRALFPLRESFVIRPDGSIIEEDERPQRPSFIPRPG